MINTKAYQLLVMLVFMGTYFTSYAAVFAPPTFTVLTPTHKPCYSGSFLVNYIVNVPPPTGYTYPSNYTFNLTQTKFELVKASAPGTILATNIGGTTSSSPTIAGSFDISAITGISLVNKPGVYIIFATVVINDIPAGKSVVTTSSATFTIGYETLWSDLTDMATLPGVTSSQRDVITSGTTYANCLSSNMIPAATIGWVDLAAQFSTATTTRSIFVPLGGTVSSAFSPASTSNYLEFVKGGTVTTTSGPGVYVKKAGVMYKLQTAVFTDRIRVERVNASTNEVRFYLTNSTTPLKAVVVSSGVSDNNFFTTISGELSIIGYSTLLQDGLLSVVSSYPCTESSVVYAQLARNLSGVNYDAFGKLNFYYDEEYAPTINTVLNYRILDWQHRTLQSSAAVSGSTVVTANRIVGDNRYQLPLASSIQVGTTYILEVSNEKKEVFYLRFTRK